MAKITLKIPKTAITSRESQLVEWFIKDGETVSLGQPLYSLETEKTTIEIECPFEGVIKLLGKVGETYKVGDPIAEIN